MEEITELRVYIASGTPNSERVVRLVEEMVADHVRGECQVTVVDVFTDHEAAATADVIVTPTIDRVRPAPLRRAVGVPETADALARGLELDTGAAKT